MESRSISKILCVCKGNTCRSPMMEVILRKELEELKLSYVSVYSARIMKDCINKPASEYSKLEVEKIGLSLDKHVSLYIESFGNLVDFDLVLCVGQDEADYVKALYPAIENRIKVVNAEFGGIPNPWQLGPEAYSTSANTIRIAMFDIAQQIKTMGQMTK